MTLDRFPRTAAALTQETLEHLLELEASFLDRRQSVRALGGGPDSGTPTFDVVLAGGGLSLIYGAYLARSGLRVAICDRRRVGAGHREWNISRSELQPLVQSGLFSAREVDDLVLAEYDYGIVRWHGGRPHPVRHVLDCAIDADRFLTTLRTRAETAGATLFDGCTLSSYRTGSAGIEVELSGATGREVIESRLLIDGTGASSAHAAFDLVCPTVGGVLTNLDVGSADDQVNPRVGEILASTEGVEQQRQHIWEGFPGNAARYTIYLFYYAEPDTLGPHPLLSLYERFFTLRPRYKRGTGTFLKPTYGFIPAYTRLRRAPSSPADRILLVGDAASRHSPLTFCGFGSMIRSFLPVADALRERLQDDRLSQRSLLGVWHEPPGLRVMGGLTLMMIPPGARGAAGPGSGEGAMGGPDEINRLLDAAFSSLVELGDETYGAFVRDEIGARDFLRFMRSTAQKRPTIYSEVFQQLTPAELATWSWKMITLAARKWMTG